MPPRPGGFAELTRAPVENLVEIPEDMPAPHAALCEPVAVAYHAVHQWARLLARPLPGLRCLVLGGGAIGLAAALVLRQVGAGEVRLIEPNATRRATEERAGIMAWAGGHAEADASWDLVLDAVGASATRAAASRLVRAGGAIVHVGLLPGSDGLDVRRLTLQEITFTGSDCYTPVSSASSQARSPGAVLGGWTGWRRGLWRMGRGRWPISMLGGWRRRKSCTSLEPDDAPRGARGVPPGRPGSLPAHACPRSLAAEPLLAERGVQEGAHGGILRQADRRARRVLRARLLAERTQRLGARRPVGLVGRDGRRPARLADGLVE